MELILVRHAIAVKHGTPGYPNDDRPLTEEGIDRMQRGARGLARLMDAPTVIAASPLSRARQTAEIISSALQTPNDIDTWKSLLPDASPASTLRDLRRHSGNDICVVLVGHEPHLSVLTTQLLKAPLQAIMYKKGGACSLEFTGFPAPGEALLRWFLTPKQLRLIA
ncbi:MAG: histidine phosphatase family protein [Calditrichaeota bacterium]|nr:histidine phosphatase family protein [Calditrichota bacterium]